MSEFMPMPIPGEPQKHSDIKLIPKLNQIDDLFSGEVADFYRHCVTDPFTSYGFFGPERCKDLRLYDWHQFTHMVYDNDLELSDQYRFLMIPLLTALDKTNRKLDVLFKIRIINSLPSDTDNSKPHIDLVGPHQTGLFFPSDSDTATTVFQQRSWLQDWEMPQEYDVALELAAKANTWYDFDGTHWRRTGRPQTASSRFCVVYNFAASPKNASE